MQTQLLLEELLALTEQSITAVKKLKTLSVIQLNHKENPAVWSALECIEHLNLYGDFYLPEIERQIITHQTKTEFPLFKPGITGNYFASLMKIKNGKIKKMKSPADKNPINSELSITTLDRFLKQQELLKSLLKQATTVNLTKVKTAISLTKFIRLRLGDTFRFFIYHIERHIIQAEKAAA